MHNKKDLLRIGIGSTVYLISIFVSMPNDIYTFLLFFISYLIIGGDVVARSVKNILNGNMLDENFLMTIATVGAFIIGEYPEAVAVMLFYQIGEYFQKYAINKSRESIKSLMSIRPEYANLIKNDEVIEVKPDEVNIGDLILIKAGERVPLDGIIVSGLTTLDTSALTGESLPRDVEVNDEVLSGCININGVITVQVTKTFSNSTVSKILDLIENASSKKSQSEKFVTKFARYYTPAVVLLAFLISVIPPLLIEGAIFSDWLYRGLTFLVISCPCGLVISIPLGFFGGIGASAKNGILIKGSNYLELLSKVDTVVFDKTGTLTKGKFKVKKVISNIVGEDELLEIASLAESYSNHPISVSIQEAYNKTLNTNRIKEVEEIAGHGVKAIIDDNCIYAGNYKLMDMINVKYDIPEEVGTVVYISKDNEYLGCIVIADEIKEDSRQTITDLKQIGVKNVVMLTGDRREVGEKIGKDLNIDTVYTELLPIDKVDKVEQLLENTEGKLVFVGDGINDAPVLKRADVGIAMGAMGSDVAVETADIVLMTDEPHKILTAVDISKMTLRVVKQNIWISLVVKGAVLALGTFGMFTMWEAVFADVGVAIISILNAMRILNIKE